MVVVQYKLYMVMSMYITFISNKSNYVALTLLSELLNLGRVYPMVYAAKVITDMHREYMKLCL